MAISSPGIGSNLDVNSIVSQLMAIEQQPLADLAKKEASFQSQISAYGSVKGALSSLQTAVQGLTDASKFQATKSASSSATDSVTATAGSSASNGSYSIEVSKLAQAQKLATAGQASSTAVIGTGTLIFDFGTISGGTFDSTTGKYTGSSFTSSGSGIKSVTINSSNNTLEGIRDAINKAGIGVSATIVNDGSNTPYRLALSVGNSGASNSMKISVSGDAGLTSLLSQDPAGSQALQETVTAQNSELKVDGIAISKPSTVITDAISGVTLNLLKTNVGTPTKVSVTTTTGSLANAVSTFVKAFNDTKKTLDDVTFFDKTGAKTGPLVGDSTIRSIQYQMRQVFSATVPGVNASYNSLAKVGVAFQKDGTLQVDSTKLQKAMDASYNDVLELFSTAGSTTDSLVSYTGSTTATTAGNYALTLTGLATQGTLTGGAVTSGLQVNAGVNDTLSVSLNGKTTTVTLTPRAYVSAADLASEIQTKINGSSDLSGNTVTIKGTGDASSFTLTGTSDLYGSTSAFSVSGTAAALFGASPVATTGTDVAGTIGGNSAAGSGQKLTSSTGASSGLAVTVTGGAATGDRGTISFSRGFASQLDTLLTNVLATKGTLAARTDGLNASIKDIGSQRDDVNRRLADTEKRYRDQFTALDVMLGSLSQTSAYLTKQLAALG
ncbi:flagellar filament capping protein FliD [Chitinivorax sp. PXF-14]|uniref:flagellar filament capping protein FliD n=1 Tax=Chitinivorax sp. PXF-14 TaxID=3230488 RepID=UPI003467DFAA